MNQVNWAEIIEHVCMQVIRRHREGEPVVQVKDIPKPEGIKWRLEPVLIEGAPTLVYGYGESGKSYLAAIWATIIAEGYPMDGLKPKPGNVLYLDWENTGRENARRFDAIHKGLGLARRSEVHYRSCSQRLSSDIQEIQKVVLEKGIDVVVVDTAGPACGGDPESAQSSIQFLMALRSLNKTTLVLAHKAKSKETTGPFGSVYWSNYPRNVFNLRADPREGDSTVIPTSRESCAQGALCDGLAKSGFSSRP